MLLHCGKEDGGCWLRAATLDSVAELNELGLALLAEQSAVRCGGAGALQPLGELWRALDGAARRRAAACPYLLLDAGFGDPARWRPAPGASQVGDAATERYARYFTVPSATEVARLVFFYAWHLSRSQPVAARLLLGMAPASVASISRHTLRQIQELAEAHPEWLRPRWAARVQVWRELLLAAGSGEPLQLERARLRGLTLLAAEARHASARCRPGADLSAAVNLSGGPSPPAGRAAGGSMIAG
jgi:hypothetical protein